MRKVLICLSLLCLLTGSVCGAMAEYKLGDRGNAVLEVKERMRDLGYFSGKKLSDSFNDGMVEKVKLFQTVNGLEATGVLDNASLALLNSDDARSFWAAPLINEANRENFVFPDLTLLDIPEHVEGGEPVIVHSRDAGYWLYESDDIRVEIKRISWPAKPLIWFETDIRLSGNEKLHRLINTTAKGKEKDVDPRLIAKENKAVFAISDDFAYFRLKRGRREGILIRDGEILGTSTYRETSTAVPNLDVMALFPDGTMKTYESNQYKAQDYLDMGVVDTFVFGPYLLRYGEINPDFQRGNTGYNTYQPRNALGMVEPNHYVFVSPLGRQTQSEGVYVQWLAYRLKDLGCVEALNLDGGNSVAIVFMGDLINKAENIDKISFMTGVRTISSMIGVGVGAANYDEQ